MLRKGYVDTSEGQIHFRVEDQGVGPTVFFFHQTASSGSMFEAMMARLAGRYRMYALDTPGFGYSFGTDRIPGIGFLFRSSSTTTQKQNLLVFLRPTVLDSRAAITTATERKFNSVYEVEIEGRDPATVISDLFNGNIP